MSDSSVGLPAASSLYASPSFERLGIEAWLCRQCSSLAMHRPTPIQSNCIPSVLAGAHVLGGAATGSGKTAAFALPMLQVLSKDIYGVFGLVLTPSRELAYQLTDQFLALGAPIRLRSLLLIGGVSHNEQVTALQARPHIVFATPGRLCFLFRKFGVEVTSSLRYLRYLVLDEADRLTEGELGKDVHWLLSEHLKPTSRRQVLLFSATLHPRLMLARSPVHEQKGKKENKKKGSEVMGDGNLEEPGEALNDLCWLPLLGIDEDSRYVVTQVGNQDTLLVSSSSSLVTAAGTSEKDIKENENGKGMMQQDSDPTTSAKEKNKKKQKGEKRRREQGEEDGIPTEEKRKESEKNKEGSIAHTTGFHLPKGLFNGYLFLPNIVKLPYLVATLRSFGKSQMTMVFVNSCVRTELVHLVLQLLGFPVCRLHSLLRQQQRLDSLAMFKLGLARVMVATDIASRGLDIPEVSAVVHYDVPKEVSSFVHRVGRTARAGREGRSIALITECDVRIIKQIEKRIGSQLTAWTKESAKEKSISPEESTPASSPETERQRKRSKSEGKKGTSSKKEENSASIGDGHTSRRSGGASRSTPAIEEEEVVKILDEVSAAKVTALQQVQETLGNRAVTLKEQAAASKERKKRESQA